MTRALRIILSDKPVAYHPILAKALGSVNCALLMSQLLYWDSTRTEDNREFYKTEAEIEEEIGLSRWEQNTARGKLIELGVISVSLKGVPRRTYYTINMERLEELIENYSDAYVEKPHTECGKTTYCSEEKPHTITENTQKNTTETENIPPLPPKKKRGRPKAEANPEVKTCLIEYQNLLGYPIDFGREGRDAKWLLSNGYTIQDILNCYKYLKTDDFWKDKPVNMNNIRNQIGEWIKHGRPVSKRNGKVRQTSGQRSADYDPVSEWGGR